MNQVQIYWHGFRYGQATQAMFPQPIFSKEVW